MSSSKWLPVIALIGMACIGIGVYSTFSSKPVEPINTVRSISNQTITLRGNDSSWHSVGSGNFTLEVTGGLDYGGGNAAGPNGSLKMGDSTALVPGVPFGTVVAKIGNGKPFMVGPSHTFNTTEQVSVAINDSYYADNKGEYLISKR